MRLIPRILLLLATFAPRMLRAAASGPVSVLMALGGTGLQAQATPPTGHRIPRAANPGGADSAARTLLRLEDGWADALVRRDLRFFQQLLADGFVYTEDDRTSTRAAVLRDLASGDTVQSAHNEAMEVHRFGATAVVTGWLVVSGRSGSGTFLRRYRFTDTWMRRGGRWQIVAAQDYLLPAGAR